MCLIQSLNEAKGHGGCASGAQGQCSVCRNIIAEIQNNGSSVNLPLGFVSLNKSHELQLERLFACVS